jgi:hypothetical protein
LVSAFFISTIFYTYRRYTMDINMKKNGKELTVEVVGRLDSLTAPELEDSLEEAYDGIWACASILHLKKEVLGKVFASMARALKGEGVLYASFKYGTFEGLRRGRHFTDFTEETFAAFLASVPVFETEETWISRDVRPGRDEEKWLNLLLRKKEG